MNAATNGNAMLPSTSYDYMRNAMPRIWMIVDASWSSFFFFVQMLLFAVWR